MVELKIIALNGQRVTFSIGYQSERCESFLSNLKDRSKVIERDWGASSYRSSFGWELRSTVFPAVDEDGKMLFLRGRDMSKDDRVMETSLAHYLMILKAIKEYNQEEKVAPF